MGPAARTCVTILLGASGCSPGDRGGGSMDAEPPPIDACTCDVSGAATFASRVDPYVFEVPAGCCAIEVKAWGGGGGGGMDGLSEGEVGVSHGGGGAFVRATLAVTAGQRLMIGVATPGEGRPLPGFGSYSGGGGGATIIARGSEILLIAGGGGGGGADGCGGCEVAGSGDGGAGGGDLGKDGEATSPCGIGQPQAIGGGGGGTQAGGSAGTGVSSGQMGKSLAGGNSFGYIGTASGGMGHLGGASTAGNGAGGAGGAGWFGGGGGGYRTTYCGAGGGGGSSYVASTATAVKLVAGAGARPGETGDPDYAAPAGEGGKPSMTGMGGRLVIRH